MASVDLGTSPPAATGTAVRFRGRGFVVVHYRAASWIAFFLIILLWEIAVRRRWISDLFLPAPSSVIETLWDLIVTGTLWLHLKASLMRLAVGWLLGTVAGILFGFSIALWSLSRAVGIPIISALFPIPKIALLPLFILWMGIGEAPKFATIALGVLFPTAIATFSAIDNVPRNLIRMAQSFDVPWLDIMRKIVFPGALPGILAAFRITASVALLLLVSAEMIGAQFGIGAFVLASGQLMQTDALLAGVVMLSVTGLLIGTTLSRIEKYLLRWR